MISSLLPTHAPSKLFNDFSVCTEHYYLSLSTWAAVLQRKSHNNAYVQHRDPRPRHPSMPPCAQPATSDTHLEFCRRTAGCHPEFCRQPVGCHHEFCRPPLMSSSGLLATQNVICHPRVCRALCGRLSSFSAIAIAAFVVRVQYTIPCSTWKPSRTSWESEVSETSRWELRKETHWDQWDDIHRVFAPPFHLTCAGGAIDMFNLNRSHLWYNT
jgi:hypothetical protein